MQPFEREVQQLIAESLMLESELDDTFDPEADLFATLGLDSVDALEIVMAVKRKWGVEFADDEKNQDVFRSLRSLAAFIRTRLDAEPS